jgi:hypothetical protein
MDRIEEHLKNLMLRNVKFVLNERTIKRGKIELFNTKQNFVKFKINEDGEIKEWELSYPYDIKKIDGGYIFDYALSAFCPRTEEVYWKMRTMNKTEASKFFDNYLYVLIS